MQHAIVEPLEPRRLFDGSGIDSTFGSADGAAVVLPDPSSVVLNTAVDSSGRVLVSGGGPGMFLTRYSADGQPDPRFGADGTIAGTPRALGSADFVIPLESGGYIVAGPIFSEQLSIIRLTPRGRVDRTFGNDGVIRLTIRAQNLLRSPDGNLFVVGDDPPRNRDFSDADYINYVVRLTPDGRVDKHFGDAGWLDIGDASFEDGFSGRSAYLTSSAVDSAGRLLLCFQTRSALFDDPDGGNLVSQTDSMIVRRLLADGTDDPTFGAADTTSGQRQAIVFSTEIMPDTELSQRSHFGVIYPRPDGQIVVLHHSSFPPEEGEPAQPVFVSLLDSSGALTSSSAALADDAPEFEANLGAAVLEDNAIILTGRAPSSAGDQPTLLRLNPDLAPDLSFAGGVNGAMITIPAPDGQTEAAMIHRNADDTLSVLTSGPSAAVQRRLFRVFTTFVPVITYLGRHDTDTSVYFTVSIRGPVPLDVSTIDGDELRLVDSAGVRRKLRLVDSVGSFTQIIARYRISRALVASGTFSLCAIDSRVRDQQADGNLSRVIGTATF